MKYNIQKLQQGGGFATFTPIVQGAPGGQKTSKSSDSKSSISPSSMLDDEAYKLLLTKGGLTNDVNNFVNELAALESSQSMPFLQSNNRSTALRMLSKINEIRQSSEY